MSTNRSAAACCSLDEAALAERRERWRRLTARALISAERTPDGARQRLRAGAGVEGELRELIALEADCCPTLSFELSVGEELSLEVRGPAHAEDVLTLFASPLERSQWPPTG
ncbi:MAG: hypothetical protein M3350_10195 [Actinomycetota bacterium]|nr:hypothetical protein [Actinomycetota bacterium]